MNTASVSGALTSEGFALDTATLTWNDESDTLTIDPALDFEYAEGNDPTLVLANEYGVAIGVGALDLAGNSLEAEGESLFTTTRRIVTSVAADMPMTGRVWSNGDVVANERPWTGDNFDNHRARGFVSFRVPNFSSAPVVESARFVEDGWQVVGDPFAVLGDLRLYHVSFTGLTAALFDTVPLRDLGVLSDGSVLPPESLSADALAAFVEDVETEREHSQYMFAFEAGTDSDGESDYASPHFSRLSLQLTYLIP